MSLAAAAVLTWLLAAPGIGLYLFARDAAADTARTRALTARYRAEVSR